MRGMVARLGRLLILGLCGYEVLSLTVEHRQARLAGLIRPLSYHCHRHRRHPLMVAAIVGLDGWLLWHLLLED